MSQPLDVRVVLPVASSGGGGSGPVLSSLRAVPISRVAFRGGRGSSFFLGGFSASASRVGTGEGPSGPGLPGDGLVGSAISRRLWLRTMRVMTRTYRVRAALGLLLGVGILLPTPSSGQGPKPVVHAILFYSPTCPHCHAVINDHLIPLQEQYGNQLVLLAFDVTQSWGSEIYWAALRRYKVPQENWVVPIMLVKDEILIGGEEIPLRLTQILQEGLAGDGVDLPDFPALLTFLDEQGMLDHRYPGRRIVLQAGPQEEPAGERGDSAQGAPETPPVPDTQAVPQAAPEPDTLEEAGGAAAPDTLTVEEAVGAAAPDTQAVVVEPRADSIPTAPRDTVGAPDSGSRRSGETPGPGAESHPDSSRSEAGAPVGGGGGEDLPSDTTSAPGTDVLPPPEGASPSAGEGAPGRRMDLAGAMEEMESMTMMDRFNQDRAGNSLSVLVLLGMLASVIMAGYPPRAPGRKWPLWVVPFLVTVGMGVAVYLSFIEITHAEAVCGPVGDCNTVNQSEYARLFGVLPVGVLGLMGYAALMGIWSVGRLGPDALRGRADLALWGAALLGTLFSIYLTFLEPFVIGATCAWCLTSAVIMTLLLWSSAPLAARAWPGVTPGEGEESPGKGA
jgi:uncharacterized membrane protein/thiol-disulfide isomerase/thioredoxin